MRITGKTDALYRLWRFAGLLEQLGYLRYREEFFAEVGGIQAKYGMRETPRTRKETDIVRECVWMMTKIIGHRVDALLGRDPTQPPLPPEGYSIDESASMKRLSSEL